MYHTAEIQYQNGVIDKAQWDTEAAAILGSLDSRRVRDWWSAVGRAFFGAEFEEFVDSLISSKPPTDSVWQTIAKWTDRKFPAKR